MRSSGMTSQVAQPVSTKAKSKIDTLTDQVVLVVLLVMGAAAYIKEQKAKSKK